MEAIYKSLSIFEFQKLFPEDISCYQYLSEKKWGKGFICKKCEHVHYCKGAHKFDRQCTSCNYSESPTAGTLFHKIKFPLIKAFWMVYYLSTNKKGISSTELSRKLELRQKTCWLFKHKIMRGMESSGKSLLAGEVEVDEFVVGQKEEGVKGRKNGTKKLVVLAIEKKGKGVSRIYAKHITKSSSKELGSFMVSNIEKEAQVRSDGWAGYTSLKSIFVNLKQEKSEKKAKNFDLIHRVIMGFKAWLRGVHSHVKHLQAYLNEYAYRFNRNLMKEGIFENLMNKLINHTPCTYKMIIN